MLAPDYFKNESNVNGLVNRIIEKIDISLKRNFGRFDDRQYGKVDGIWTHTIMTKVAQKYIACGWEFFYYQRDDYLNRTEVYFSESLVEFDIDNNWKIITREDI